MSASTPAADPDAAPGLSFKGLFPARATAGDPPRPSPSLLHRTLTERLLFAEDDTDGLDDDEQLPVLRIPAASRVTDSDTFSIGSCETTSDNTRDGASDEIGEFEKEEEEEEEEEERCIVRVPRSCSADPAGAAHGPAAKFAAIAALHSLPASPCLARRTAPAARPDEACMSRAANRAAALQPTAVAGALLPTVAGAPRAAPFPSVAPQTVAELLDGTRAVPAGHRLLIIDCRYPYEYAGGHIRTAVNVPVVGLRARLQELLYPSSTQEKEEEGTWSSAAAAEPAQARGQPKPQPRTILLFHCEFSQERGPRVMRAVRALDREHNLAQYPRLDYDQLYLIHGGYVLFHALHPHLCVPDSAYVPMRHPRFAAHLAACRAARSRERSRTRHTGGRTLARRALSDLPASPSAAAPLLRSFSGALPARLLFADDSDSEPSCPGDS